MDKMSSASLTLTHRGTLLWPQLSSVGSGVAKLSLVTMACLSIRNLDSHDASIISHRSLTLVGRIRECCCEQAGKDSQVPKS